MFLSEYTIKKRNNECLKTFTVKNSEVSIVFAFITSKENP